MVIEPIQPAVVSKVSEPPSRTFSYSEWKERLIVVKEGYCHTKIRIASNYNGAGGVYLSFGDDCPKEFWVNKRDVGYIITALTYALEVMDRKDT